MVVQILMASLIVVLSASTNPPLEPWWGYSYSYSFNTPEAKIFPDYYGSPYNTGYAKTFLQDRLPFQMELPELASFKKQQQRLDEVLTPLKLISWSGRLLVAITKGPNQFQDEFDKVSRELAKGNEDLYDKIRSGMSEQVEQMMVISQKLIDGQPLDALLATNDQESRWFGWILYPYSVLITKPLEGAFSFLVNIVRLYLKLLILLLRFIFSLLRLVMFII